jgi:1-acyl-sn-glycerol-3-phosphate acyltransferase
MKNIFYFLFTLALWPFCAASFLTHAFIYILTHKFVRNKRLWSFKLAQPIMRSSFIIFNCPLQAKRIENIPNEKNFIIASNHQSILDIYIHLCTMTKPISFFAKQELTRIPVLGWEMKMQGHFLVDRKRPKKAIKQMKEVKSHILSGYSALIFPEGTRSLDDRILPFKRGAFVLAVQTGTTVVPSYIHGSNHVIHKTRFLCKPSKVTVTYGKPILVKKATTKEEEKKFSQELMEKVRIAVLELSDGRG